MTLILLLFLPCCLAETWTVYVYTGNERFAGTDSNVYIRLYNEDGESTSEMQLTHSNWLPEKNEIPVRNLFEAGARERFTIKTEYIGSVAKIEIRHNNFPAIQADWLLDHVIVESNRNGIKYIFNCNCWLRRRKPYITISALTDERTNDKNKGSSSKHNQTFVIILIVLITLIICIFCCFNEYRRRQRRRSLSLTNTIEQIQEEPALLDAHHSSQSRSSSPASGPQLWINTMRRWKNLRNGLPSYNHTRTTQSTTTAAGAAVAAVPTEEPPSYEDLYPNTNVPINTALSSNL